MSAMTAQNMINVMEKILDSSTTGFASVQAELRGIRMSAVTTVRNTNLMLQEQKKTTAAVLDMVDHLKNFANGSKQTTEDKIEARKGTATESERGEKKTNPLMDLLFALGSMAASFLGQMRVGAALLMRSVRVGIAGLSARIIGLFKGIRMPRALETLGATIGRALGGLGRVGRMFAPIGAMVARVGQFLAPLMRMLGPIAGVAARLGGFLKFIPVVGQVLLVLMAAFDGIKGFIKGFSNTDGNLLEKLWGGFKGAIVGIVKGLISPFVWLGKMIWNGIKGLASILGLDKLAETIGKIDFGELFKKVVSVFRPTGNMFKELWDMFKDFLRGVFTKVREGGRAVAEGAQNAAQYTADAATTGARAAGAAVDRVTRPRVTSQTQSLPPEARALLDTIAGTESPGYDVMYGGGRFDPAQGHPNQPVRITRGPNRGRNSTAAGRYQFLHGTWQQVAADEGLTDFGPESQDKGAWALAVNNYRTQTGRDLLADLRDPRRAGEIGSALGGTWTSLPGGIEAGTNESRFGREYRQNLERQRATAPRQATPAPAPQPRAERQRQQLSAAEREQQRRERFAMVGRTPNAPQAPVVVNNNNTTNNGGTGSGGNRTRYRRGGLDGYSSWADPVRGAS